MENKMYEISVRYSDFTAYEILNSEREFLFGSVDPILFHDLDAAERCAAEMNMECFYGPSGDQTLGQAYDLVYFVQRQ